MCSKCFSLDILRKGKAWFSMYSVGVTLYPISPGLLERSMKLSMQSLGLSRDPNKGFPRKQVLVCQSLIPCHSRPHLSDTECSTTWQIMPPQGPQKGSSVSLVRDKRSRWPAAEQKANGLKSGEKGFCFWYPYPGDRRFLETLPFLMESLRGCFLHSYERIGRHN